MYCVSPTLARHLLGFAADDAGETTTVLLHVSYYVFISGWRRTDAAAFVYRPDIVPPTPPPVAPRVLHVAPPFLRLPRTRRADAPPTVLFEVQTGARDPVDYTAAQDSFPGFGTSVSNVRCRLTASFTIQMDAVVVKGATPAPVPVRGAEDAIRVLCVSGQNEDLASAGRELLSEQAYLEISFDGGASWSGQDAASVVQVLGPDVLNIRSLRPSLRLLDPAAPAANVTLLGSGFRWLFGLSGKGPPDAALECVWSPRSLEARIQGGCRTPARLHNDTALLCAQPPEACMQRRGLVSLEASEVELRWGSAASPLLVLGCGPDLSDCDSKEVDRFDVGCLHTAIPAPKVWPDATRQTHFSPLEGDRSDMPAPAGLSVLSSGGPLRLNVGGLPAAGLGSVFRWRRSVQVVCRFRHHVAGFGLLGAPPVMVPAVMEEPHLVTCRAPNYNATLGGGFFGNLAHADSEVWQWLLDVAFDGGYAGVFLPAQAIVVRTAREEAASSTWPARDDVEPDPSDHRAPARSPPAPEAPSHDMVLFSVLSFDMFFLHVTYDYYKQ